MEFDLANLTLEIFIGDDKNYYRRNSNLPLLFSRGIAKLTYDGFSLQKNGEDEPCVEKNFPIWDTIHVEIEGEIEIENEEFWGVELTPLSKRFCVVKKDIDKIKDFCNNRNQKMFLEKESICNYVDDDVLNIAENLLNIIEEDLMLNYRVVAGLHTKYSHNNSKIFENYYNCEYRVTDRRYGRYNFLKDTDLVKGKQKKEAEMFNEELRRKTYRLSKIVDNFVEIIMEEKNVKEYIAKAVAWEAIQREAIEYFSQKWKEEYENNLDNTFDELYVSLDNQDIDNIKRDYIKRVLLCDEIDMEHSQGILIYFLLSKCNLEKAILCDCFVEHYELIEEIKEGINSEDIKQKLKTKQKRKITKYTIDDVDLMTGTEFEEFVGLLFKKMGYSSQVTKQSGDQGLDVIATRNGTKIGIQAKCYSNTVGNSAVQEAVAGKSFYDCDKVLVITNNYFTSAAMELAQSNNVILWDRDMLKEKIKELM